MGIPTPKAGADLVPPSLEVVVQQERSKRSAQIQEKHQLIEQDEQDEIEPTSKQRKPLSFHLAFVGLSLLLLVFQMDATCLSIALPVREVKTV